MRKPVGSEVRGLNIDNNLKQIAVKSPPSHALSVEFIKVTDAIDGESL